MPASWAEAKAALPQLPIPVMLFLPEHGQLHVLMVPIPSHIGFLLQSITFTVASMASEQEIKNCRLLNGGCFLVLCGLPGQSRMDTYQPVSTDGQLLLL